MSNISEHFIERIFIMSHADIPKPVMEKSRDCFLDYLAVLIGGCKVNCEIDTKFIKENHLTGDSVAIGVPVSTDLRTAVFLNAFHAHILELDDGHRAAMTHPGAPIFSVLLSVGALYGCTLEQLLRAAVIGYEAAIRLAEAIQPGHKKKGFHATGTCCTVGCALGVASLLNYSQQEMENVLSASATSAAGLLAVITGKSKQKPYNIANAALAGTNAALYGKYFNGPQDVLDDPRGVFHVLADRADPGKLFADGYAIEGIYQKLYAACRHCHAPMEAMLRIMEDADFSPGDVENILVRVYDLAVLGHDHTEITGVSSAKQSIPYGVAAACMYRQCGEEAFTQERVENEELLSLVKRVRIEPDEALSALVPQKRPAIVEVICKNGERRSQRVDYPRGEPESPITKEDLVKKFFSLTENAGIDHDAAEQILEFVTGSPEKPVAQLAELLKNI